MLFSSLKLYEDSVIISVERIFILLYSITEKVEHLQGITHLHTTKTSWKHTLIIKYSHCIPVYEMPITKSLSTINTLWSLTYLGNYRSLCCGLRSHNPVLCCVSVCLSACTSVCLPVFLFTHLSTAIANMWVSPPGLETSSQGRRVSIAIWGDARASEKVQCKKKKKDKKLLLRRRGAGKSVAKIRSSL